MTRAVLIDPSVVGQSHLVVNMGFIDLLLSLYDIVEFIAEKAHCEAIADYYDNNKPKSLYLYSYDSYKSKNSFIIKRVTDRSADQVIFLNVEYDLMIALAFRAVRLKLPVYWVLHSHLLSLEKSKNLKADLFNFAKFKFFSSFHNYRFIVCSRSAKLEALRFLGLNRFTRSMCSVFHPVSRATKRAVGTCSSSYAMDSTSIRLIYSGGWHSTNVNQEKTLELIGQMAERRSFVFDLDRARMASGPVKHFVDDYATRIRTMQKYDAVLFLPVNNYRLQASGKIIDCIISCIPIIGVSTYFSKELEELIGVFGYFFDTEEELCAFLSSVPLSDLRNDLSVIRVNIYKSIDKVIDASLRELKTCLAKT